MRHYEVLFYKIIEIDGIRFPSWLVSERIFEKKENAIRYAEKTKGDRKYKVLSVETDICGNPTKGHEPAYLIKRALTGV